MKRPIKTCAVLFLLTHLIFLFLGLDSKTGATTELFLIISTSSLACSIVLFMADFALQKRRNRK